MGRVQSVAQRVGSITVNFVTSAQSPARARVTSLRGLMCRVLLTTILVILTHQFEWVWLRFLTSEAVLRGSALVGMATERFSFDTVGVQGEAFRFVVSCTFVDVFIGTVPLIWNLKRSILSNGCILVVTAIILFSFNILRLVTGHLLHAHGAPWIVADDLLGGMAYFFVALVIAWWSGLSAKLVQGVRTNDSLR